MGTCCSLPKSTPITVKACFTRRDLDSISDEEIDSKSHCKTFQFSYPLGQPEVSFDIEMTIGNSYHEFLCQLSQQISEYIALHSFVLNEEIRYIRYQTAYGLQVYKLPANKSSTNQITFSQLFSKLPFIDWSTGYALIVWFDSKLFSTNLDQALDTQDIISLHSLLGIKHEMDIPSTDPCYKPLSGYVFTPGAANGNYVQINGEYCDELLPDPPQRCSQKEGEMEGISPKIHQQNVNHDGSYVFSLEDDDIMALLSMNDVLITEYLIEKHYDCRSDISLDRNSFLFCVEHCYHISKCVLIAHNLPFIFKLSPFYAIQWHAVKFGVNTCYQLAKSGLFNIRQREDHNIVKVCELQSSFLNPPNIDGISRGRKERLDTLLSLWESTIGVEVISAIQEFESGDWNIFDEAVNC